ncbi:MAG: aminotransferase [Caldimonas sp.]|uniref:DegT/DnrJ/EryC1/StrS family aminotransferase n=1 Tax=Caldimonas taiwanensis TaxID=307483 RepID=UPI000A00D273|nr:DegT/DnrJ/EryC1/StrS family aminotransferase [Caldimonas taiwanensis]GIX23377.1 MAG: aminotransferase [Caldimonas sp.]
MHRVHVARPELPPLESLLPSLQEIWSSRVLTNGGPFHQRFEAALMRHLGVAHLSLCTNATIGLMLALRALGLRGEVITTPFTFVATVQAIEWAGLTPVFADIDPVSLNLDPGAVERAITTDTCAILPVHCFGHACDVDAFEALASTHGLRLVYDAAHAFGVRLRGRSLMSWGDVSVMSFHATKVFNTFEGGAMVARDKHTKAVLDRLKNFGIVEDNHVEGLGLNGKMNEFCAALGLLQLEHIDASIRQRAHIDAYYREGLAGVPGIVLPRAVPEEEPNHAYFPIRVEPAYGQTRDDVLKRLKANGIHARRYFFPLVSDLPRYRDRVSPASRLLPVARAVADQILCLPIYPGLQTSEQSRIIELLRHDRA